MKFLLASLLAGSAAAFIPSSSFQGNNVAHRSATKSSLSMETGADLAILGKKLNPVIGKYDPLNLAGYNFWGTSEEETIGFLREAEVKHGRVAMFAFVGYIVHANGITWPWAMTLDGTPFPKVSNAPEAWDAIPEAAKWQIIMFVGFLEFYNEIGNTHYMKGGKIGDFPDFDAKVIPGGALNFYDPLGWHKTRSEEDKANGLVKEINNGRAAMLGIIAFLSEGKVPGAVPLLKGIIPAYAGEPMAPFATSILPHL